MKITEPVSRWFANWRVRRNQRDISAWDNPATGTDLLAAMLSTNKRRKEPLP